MEKVDKLYEIRADLLKLNTLYKELTSKIPEFTTKERYEQDRDKHLLYSTEATNMVSEYVIGNYMKKFGDMRGGVFDDLYTDLYNTAGIFFNAVAQDQFLGLSYIFLHPKLGSRIDDSNTLEDLMILIDAELNN